MTTKHSADKTELTSTLFAVLGSGTLLTLLSPLLFAEGALLSVALGALLAALNLWVIAWMVRGFLFPVGTRAPWAGAVLLKFLLLFALVALLLKSGLVRILPLALGYAALPIGIVVAQLRSAPPVREDG